MAETRGEHKVISSVKLAATGAKLDRDTRGTIGQEVEGSRKQSAAITGLDKTTNAGDGAGLSPSGKCTC